MNRPASHVLSTIVLAAALILAGCGQGSDTTNDPAPSPSVSGTPSAASSPSVAASASGVEAPTDRLTGKSGTYSVAAPAGWSDGTAQAGQNSQNTQNLDLVLLSSTPVDKFSDNLVVVVTDGDEAAVDTELEQGRVKLTEAGRKVTDADDVTIEGATAKGLTSTFDQQGIAITARSYALAHEGKIYLLTLSSSTANQEAAKVAFKQITSSWQWS